MNKIIFTDLDGTLLDANTYSSDAALPALRMIEEQRVPLILCSSKTRAEIEFYRRKLNNRHPFVSENGGAIFIPEGYFDFPFPYTESRGQYLVIELGTPYATLRSVLKRIEQEQGARISGFGDMDVEEIMTLTGLTRDEAELARQREYDEPFVVKEGDEALVIEAIHRKGYTVTRARFPHILGKNDKGRAVTILKGLFRSASDDIRTLAIGDSPNDVAMLDKADVPVLVQKPDGTYDDRVDFSRLRKAAGIGPHGWNRTVLDFLSSDQ